MIFTQLTCVKQKLQHVLNTRSLNSKNSAVVQISNIDIYTWMYIIMDLPAKIEARMLLLVWVLLLMSSFRQAEESLKHNY